MNSSKSVDLPGQVVLVLQGGGALGAYQWGVYEALHEAGIEPDWVIGTSIGAINAALIAGNPPAQRGERLKAFWHRIEQPQMAVNFGDWGFGNLLANLSTFTRGVPGFFDANPQAMRGAHAEVGIEQASYYRLDPLRRTLAGLIDFDCLKVVKDKDKDKPQERATRLTVGCVNVCSGDMRYFDSRDETLGIDHILASSALPPAFGAVRIAEQAYWDGGLYSNTPIEAVFDDRRRRDALIFSVNVWHESGPEPQSIWEVMARVKDIQYASRADSHILRQKQIHRLRHIIGQLGEQLPPEQREDPDVKSLLAWGCRTTMHVAHLLAPRLAGEDSSKDIDFSPAGVSARHKAGRADAQRMIKRAPWNETADPIEGVIEHR